MLRVHFGRVLEGDWPLALPVRQGEAPPEFVTAAAAEDFSGAAEAVCDVYGGARRVLLLGTGEAPDVRTLETAGAIAAARALQRVRLTLDLRGWSKNLAMACITGAVLRAWRCEKYRTKLPDGAPRLTDLFVVTDDENLEQKFQRQTAVLAGVEFARDLVTEPANVLTPDNFAARLEDLAGDGMVVTILRGQALADARLTGLLAVGGAAANPPALAVLRWCGTIETPPLAFVGKGITFDTGGIDIKPADRMWEMRADMAGAAACAGVMKALKDRASPAPVIAVLALAENAIGDNAYRPSDVLCHASGTTIEVVDTDAEGRLVLADALFYAAREKPAAIIDLATLTGSVITALGHHHAGLYGNDPPLGAAIAAAGAHVGETVWHLPIDESHRRDIDSDIADVRHCSPERGQPDASHAAAFLREFVDDVPWAHLDIAGVESVEEAEDRRAAGATGWGVRLLDRLVRDRFEDPHRV